MQCGGKTVPLKEDEVTLVKIEVTVKDGGTIKSYATFCKRHLAHRSQSLSRRKSLPKLCFQVDWRFDEYSLERELSSLTKSSDDEDMDFNVKSKESLKEDGMQAICELCSL